MDQVELENALRALGSGEGHLLADLQACPREPGVYTLWDGATLLYVGIARVAPRETRNPAAAGIRGRLGSYTRARLTTDFAISVFLRFIAPRLSADDRAMLASGQLGARHMGERVKSLVETRIAYRTWPCEGSAPSRIEDYIRRHGLPGVDKPAFNARS